jgi:hypothetical protein
VTGDSAPSHYANRAREGPSTVADMPGTRRRRGGQGIGWFAWYLRCSRSSTTVDASVRIQGEDRAGLERLIRYCARGPLALERLHAPAGFGTLTSPEARLVYRLPEPDVHRREVLRLTPLELLDLLARSARRESMSPSVSSDRSRPTRSRRRGVIPGPPFRSQTSATHSTGFPGPGSQHRNQDRWRWIRSLEGRRGVVHEVDDLELSLVYPPLPRPSPIACPVRHPSLR